MRRFLPVCLCLAVLIQAQAAQAHPHEWIDVRSVPVFNAAGQIEAIREHWLFDIYYTALSIPDFDANHNKVLDPDELLYLAQDNLRNLSDYSYFTFVDAGPEATGFEAFEDVGSRMEQGRIGMDFTLVLESPVDPRSVGFSYRIYDPSYYVSMIHEKDGGVRLEGAEHSGCAYELQRPEPNAVWVSLAQSLDKNATAPDDLGKYFAERVAIACH